MRSQRLQAWIYRRFSQVRALVASLSPPTQRIAVRMLSKIVSRARLPASNIRDPHNVQTI